ncbi:MAG TPA: hypothetical protein VMZ92_06970 [Planctomycetota bacterium]|nr:hypothetical protein [Planctomycetota bacterium]
MKRLTEEDILDRARFIQFGVLIDPEWAKEVIRLALWAVEHQRDSADCDLGNPYDYHDPTSEA